jgi:hypothetical protein
VSRASKVSAILSKVEEKLGKDVKASLGDYIRLMQLQKEWEEDEVREITVTWIDPEAVAVKAPKAPAKRATARKKAL